MQLYAVFVGIGLKTFCKCKLKIKSLKWEGCSPDKHRAFIKGKTLGCERGVRQDGSMGG